MRPWKWTLHILEFFYHAQNTGIWKIILVHFEIEAEKYIQYNFWSIFDSLRCLYKKHQFQNRLLQTSYKSGSKSEQDISSILIILNICLIYLDTF